MGRKNKALILILVVSFLALAIGGEGVTLEQEKYPFLSQDVEVTVQWPKRSINILSPENKTYFDKKVTLRFEVEGNPLLVGYSLNQQAIKWYMVKENQIAEVLNENKKHVLSANVSSFRDSLFMFFCCERLGGRWYTSNGFSLDYLTNISGDATARFGIIKDQVLSYYISRGPLTSPPLEIGVDLKLSDYYNVYPLSIDFTKEEMEIVAAKKSEFKTLNQAGVYEFELGGIDYGEYNLTIYAVDRKGVESSHYIVFTIDVSEPENPDIVILANSIDYSQGKGLLGYLMNNGLAPLRLTNESFSQYKNESIILILGGPDAPDGVGGIVRTLLIESEQNAVRKNGSQMMFVKNDVWTERQLVIVLAGSNREGTQKAHAENRLKVVNRGISQALDETGKTWVETYPIQCMGNPWEEEWLRTNGSSQEYYKKPNIVIGDYYFKKHGVVISDIKTKSWEGAVCHSCDCPVGFTLFLLIYNPDVYKMLDLGYKMSSVPPT